jgi:hypothetical protein
MGESKEVLLDVAGIFHELVGRIGEHGVVAGDEKYVQPYVYVSLHLVQMRAAGWDVDYDHIAAVSGASALFAYQPGEFMPKYAHLYVEPDRRIAEATGFHYEWTDFADAGEAWNLITKGVDAGRSLKGWDWENILFAGYEGAREPQERRVYAMADGPDTYAKWLTWGEFSDWALRIRKWGVPRLGRYDARVEAKPIRDVALRVMRDLVEWSVEPPQHVRDQWPKATYGLAGIEAYASTCEGSDTNEDWVACHDINGQWAVRNSTSVYLKRVAEAGVFRDQVNAHLRAAAKDYRAAYESWQELYDKYLGHGVPEARRRTHEHRVAGAAAIWRGLAHEKAGLAEIERALAVLE